MIEIKQINTGVAEIIAVKVPDGITGWAIGNGCIYFNSVGVKLIPYGDYEALGLSTELTEEQCVPLIRQSIVPLFNFTSFEISDGLGTVSFSTAKEAFASLMQANGINEPHLILKRLS